MRIRSRNRTSIKGEKLGGLLYKLLLAALLPGMIYFVLVAAVRFTPLMRWGDTPATSQLLAFTALPAALVTILMGFLVIRRAPGNVCGPLLVLSGIGSANTGLYDTVQNGYAQAALQFTNTFVYLWVLIALFVYFPDGAAFRPWVGRVIGWFALLLLTLTVLEIVSDPLFQSVGVANPVYQAAFAPLLPIVEFTGSVLLFVSLISSLAAVILRYRAVAGHKRQQMRWFMFCSSSLLVLVLAWLVGIATQQGKDSLYFWLLLVISDIALPLVPAVGIGVGILRHRLYDIDIIIRRTLVYSLLTVLLAGVYFGGVVLLQALLKPLTGASNDLAVVATTLLIAAIFLPLRQRVQSLIDRRFFRRKYDAARMVVTFSEHVRDEVELDNLARRLVEVVDETLQPTHISLWLRDPGRQTHTIAEGDTSQ